MGNIWLSVGVQLANWRGKHGHLRFAGTGAGSIAVGMYLALSLFALSLPLSGFSWRVPAGGRGREGGASTLYAHLGGREGGVRPYMRIMWLCRLCPWLSAVPSWLVKNGGVLGSSRVQHEGEAVVDSSIVAWVVAISWQKHPCNCCRVCVSSPNPYCVGDEVVYKHEDDGFFGSELEQVKCGTCPGRITVAPLAAIVWHRHLHSWHLVRMNLEYVDGERVCKCEDVGLTVVTWSR